MKNLNYYKEKNLITENEIFLFFIENLKDSIYTWEYFTDFEKSIKNANKYKKELNLLSKLIGIESREINDRLIALIEKEPKVKKAILLLIGLRPSKIKDTAIINDFDTLTSKNKSYLFKPSSKVYDEFKADFLEFFEDTGIKKFLADAEVSNLLDYCKGVEVGMDTNGRKNRTGTIMESIVEVFVKNLCNENNFEYISQATCKKIICYKRK